MQKLAIGDVAITRVEESITPLRKPEDFLVGFDPAELERHKSWLYPTHIDPNTEFLNLSIHSYLVRTRHHTILVDTCVGNHKARPLRANWNMQTYPFLERLAEAGVTPEQVDIVLCTHLHIDHVGWNTQLKDGRWVPTFPNARYVCGKAEYEYWVERHQSGERGFNHGAFHDSVLPIIEAGQMVPVENGHTLDDGMVIEPNGGHTPGHVTLRVTSNGQEGLFTGDIIHHPLQVYRPEWNSVACMVPDQAIATRRRVLESLADKPSLMLPAHFCAPTVGRVKSAGGKFSWEFVG